MTLRTPLPIEAEELTILNVNTPLHKDSARRNPFSDLGLYRYLNQYHACYNAGERINRLESSESTGDRSYRNPSSVSPLPLSLTSSDEPNRVLTAHLIIGTHNFIACVGELQEPKLGLR
jgi:hypothetical protein